MSHEIPPPEEHGDDARRIAARLGLDPDTVLDLSVSTNPVAPDVVPTLARHLRSVRSYPEVRDATRALAAHIGVDARRLILTNGAAEAIALVASELSSGWADECDFSLYRRHLPHLDPAGPRFRSNPHNPSGRLADRADRAAVWDESFYPLAAGTWTRGDAGSIVIGSLTKLLACPGLRVGYVIGPDEAFVERIAARQPRWAVNGIVCAALPDLLECVDLAGWRASVADLRRQLHDVLARAGLDPLRSDANYVLCEKAGALRSQLAPHGIVVRDCTSFGIPDGARVAVPDADGLERLETTLRHLGLLG